MKIQFKALSVILFSILSFTSCSSQDLNDPISTAKTILENKCLQKSKGYLKVENFVKRESAIKNINGVVYYVLDCDFDMVGTKDGGYLNNEGTSIDGKFIYIESFMVVFDSAERKRFINYKYPVEKGRRYKFKGNWEKHITLEKKQNEWVLSNIDLKNENSSKSENLEADAKKYAELLCKVQKNGESAEITKELQKIIDRYSNDAVKSEEFGKQVESEFNKCK